MLRLLSPTVKNISHTGFPLKPWGNALKKVGLEITGDAEWLANCLMGQIQGSTVCQVDATMYVFVAFHSSNTDNSPHLGPVWAVQLNRCVFGEADVAEAPSKTRWKSSSPLLCDHQTCILVTVRQQASAHQGTAFFCLSPSFFLFFYHCLISLETLFTDSSPQCTQRDINKHIISTDVHIEMLSMLTTFKKKSCYFSLDMSFFNIALFCYNGKKHIIDLSFVSSKALRIIPLPFLILSSAGDRSPHLGPLRMLTDVTTCLLDIAVMLASLLPITTWAKPGTQLIWFCSSWK